MKSCENCQNYKPLNNRKGTCSHVAHQQNGLKKERKRHEICANYTGR